MQNPLLYGARLSGKLDRNWRVGILNTQTARQESRGIPGQNYTVAVLQRQIFGRSTISALLMNRSEIGGSTPENRFTRLAGLEYNLQTADNRWSGKVFYHQAFKPQEATQKDDRANEANAHGLNLTYTSRNLTLAWQHEYIGRSYRVNDIGYVPRRGYWKFVPSVQTTFYVKGERGIVSHGPFADALIIRNIEGGLLTDRELNAGYGVQFRNTAEGGFGIYNNYTYLFFSFDPTNADGRELPANTAYAQRGVFGFFNSDRRKLLNMQLEGYAGGYFNGKNTSLTAQVQYRFQPFGSVSLTGEYNNIRLPEPYSSAQYLLLGPRIDVTFSRKLFVTTFMQFNNQTDNVNLNARLQWRYAPVSDLFVVYTENYLPGSFGSKNRALVIKLSYWLNV